MSDTENAAPAGASEGVDAPSSLSMEEAVSRFADASQEPDEDRESEAVSPEGTDEETDQPTQPEGEGEGEAETEAEAEPETAEAPEGAEADNSSEDAGIPLEKIHGNTKINLREGVSWTGKQLKENIERLENVDRHQAELSHKEAQFHQWANQRSQEFQQFQQIAPVAIKALEMQIPPEPEFPEWDASDPVTSMEARHQYDVATRERQAKIGELQQLQAFQQQQQFQAQQEYQARQQEYLQNQTNELLQRMPELKNPENAKVFYDKATQVAAHYGFGPQEIAGLSDARFFPLLKDLAAYRELQTNPPKPLQSKPQQTTPRGAPVAKPGRQVTGADAKTQKRQEMFQRAKRQQGGLSIDDASRLLMSLED